MLSVQMIPPVSAERPSAASGRRGSRCRPTRPSSQQGRRSPGAGRSRSRKTSGSALSLTAFWTRAIARLKEASVTLDGIVAVLEHDEPERVAHRVPDADPAFQLRVLEELLDRSDRVGRGLVPGDAVHARGPRERVVAVRVERGVLLRRDEVLEVRDQALVELLDPLVVDVLPQEAVVVGRNDDVASDALASRQPSLNLREVAGVVVDLLVVVDLDPRLLRELLERRRLVDAGLLERRRRVDVERPVREVEDLVELAAASTLRPHRLRRRRAAPGSESAVAPAAPRRSSSPRDIRESIIPSPPLLHGRPRKSPPGSSSR